MRVWVWIGWAFVAWFFVSLTLWAILKLKGF